MKWLMIIIAAFSFTACTYKPGPVIVEKPAREELNMWSVQQQIMIELPTNLQHQPERIVYPRSAPDQLRAEDRVNYGS